MCEAILGVIIRESHQEQWPGITYTELTDGQNKNIKQISICMHCGFHYIHKSGTN